jgi:hypothetical protein
VDENVEWNARVDRTRKRGYVVRPELELVRVNVVVVVVDLVFIEVNLIFVTFILYTYL